VYHYGILALWVGVFSIFGVIGVSVWYILRGQGKLRFVRSQQVLALVMLSSIIALLIGPLTRPVFLTAARNAPAQTLLGNVFDGFIAPFNSQAIVVGVIASALLALPYWHLLVGLHCPPLPKKRPPRSQRNLQPNPLANELSRKPEPRKAHHDDT
jgi:hypothetical protein